MRPATKIVLLKLAKFAGLFRLSGALTARHLRILCYHGASWDDEHEFRPELFMSPGVFEQRMSWLRRNRFPVLRLSDALRLRRDGRLPPRATVITIDDGWSGTGEFMFPVLRDQGFAATLYVATQPVETGGVVFDVFLPYVLWRGRHRRIDLAAIDPRLEGVHSLARAEDRRNVAERLVDLCRKSGPETVRALTASLEGWLASVPKGAPEGRAIQLMAMSEFARAREYDVDLQLHTHTHKDTSHDPDALAQEIRVNRAALSAYASSSLVHFCYPGGIYQPDEMPVLASLGVESATTCDRGLVDPGTPDLLLPRILDADDLDPIVFEAEMWGLLEIGRRIGRALGLGAPRDRAPPT